MALIPLPIMEDEALNQEVVSSPFPVLGSRPTQPQKAITKPQDLSSEEQRMQELERMLQEAQGRAELMEREAYDKAYAAGEKAGMVLGEKRAEQSLQNLERMMAQAEQSLKDLERHCTHVVLDLAQAVMCHVLDGEKEQWHSLLLAAVEKAALQFPEVQDLVLQLNADDIQGIETLMHGEESKSWRLQADASLKVGTCRLMSRKQDVYIDPYQAIESVVLQLRDGLLKGDDVTVL